MSEKKNNALDFEKAIKRLEQITEELGKEGVRLDDALALYEEGVKLVKACNATLEDTERKIKMLRVCATGELEEADFNENANNEN